MRPKYLLLIGVFLGFLACQKEPDPAVLSTPTSNCKIDKINYFDSTSLPYDTAGYVYNTSQVTRVNFQDYYITLEYTNNKVSKRNYFDYSSGTSVLYDKFTYNTDGTLQKVETYAIFSVIPTPILFIKYDFTYSGGKLTKLVQSEDTTGTGNMLAATQSDYTYTGNNITKCVYKDFFTPYNETFTYTYDANTNYFAKNSNFLYTDNTFTTFDGTLLPLDLSANNVTKISYASGGSTDLTYTLDGNHNLAVFLADGSIINQYSYKCQ